MTMPMDIAKGISKSLSSAAVVATVDGQAWDLLRPLEADCRLSIHTFEEREGKEVCATSAAMLAPPHKQRTAKGLRQQSAM